MSENETTTATTPIVSLDDTTTTTLDALPSTAIKVLSETDDLLKVGGYGVIFGGRDLEGETFTKGTDYMLDMVPVKPVFYDHSLRPGMDDPMGMVGNEDIKVDDIGIWVESELHRHAEYMAGVEKLIAKGALGYSSGTVGHLARREGKNITRWPIVEFSLTATPAEPRTLGVSQLKSLAKAYPNLEAALLEVAQDSHDASATEQVSTAKRTKEPITGELEMSDETKEAPQPDVVTSEQFEELDTNVKAMASAVNALLEREQKAAEAADKAAAKTHPGIQVEDEADRALKGNQFTLGEFLMAVKDVPLGRVDPRLLPTRSNDPMDEGGFNMAKAVGSEIVGSLSAAKAYKASPTGLGESSGPAGGYLVDSDRNNSILSRVYESGQLLSRVAVDQVGPNANGMTYYADAETSRATGSRHGGVRGYWVAENSAVTASSPTFRTMELKLKKAGALVYATDELLSDVSALQSYVMRLLPEELRFLVEDAIVNGDGSGTPLGFLQGNGKVSVAKETGQAATTVVTENLDKMWSRLWARSQRNSIWLINQDVQPQLFGLNRDVGTGGSLVFSPPGGISGAPYGTLFGRPVIVHESMATLGTVGDIVLVDPSQYQMIEKGGIDSASSIHVRFTQGEQTFRFFWRIDGQPTWDSALTPFKGSNTVAPVITLATRS